MRKSVYDSVINTVQDLYKSGLIDSASLKNIKTLCIPQIREYHPESIIKIRKKMKLTQKDFASLFNVSPSTVQNWEKGYKKPNGASKKLLSLAENKGIEGLI